MNYIQTKPTRRSPVWLLLIARSIRNLRILLADFSYFRSTGMTVIASLWCARNTPTVRKTER